MSHSEKLNLFLKSVERRAYRMAEMAVFNRDDALDLVQDAMLGLVRKYRHKPEQEWKFLFYRILQSRIRDWYRRQAVKNRLFIWRSGHAEDENKPDLLAQTADLSIMDPVRKLETDRFTPAFEAALLGLPYRQRQVFLLRIWEGLDVEQTAKAMVCSEGSVKTHMFRALRALRRALADYHY